MNNPNGGNPALILICILAVIFAIIANTLGLPPNIEKGAIFTCLGIICLCGVFGFWSKSWVITGIAIIFMIVFFVLARNAFAQPVQDSSTTTTLLVSGIHKIS